MLLTSLLMLQVLEVSLFSFLPQLQEFLQISVREGRGKKNSRITLLLELGLLKRVECSNVCDKLLPAEGVLQSLRIKDLIKDCLPGLGELF